jgi:hypothetical protein
MKKKFKEELIMKKIVKAILIVIVMIITLFILTGCTEVSRVSENIRQEADNFNITRRISVINARTDKPIFELIGNFSLQNNSNKELEIIVEVENGKYKKHFIYLNDWTMYVVEDVSGAFIDKYHYEINYLPEMIQPFTIKSKD